MEDTPWHYDWKLAFEQNGFRVEQVIDHRFADAVGDGVILILQSGAITLEEAQEKEAHFGREMHWLWDARTWLKTVDGTRNLYTFDRPRKGLLSLKRPIFLHLASGDLVKVHVVNANAASVLGQVVTLDTTFLTQPRSAESTGSPPTTPPEPYLHPKGVRRKSPRG